MGDGSFKNIPCAICGRDSIFVQDIAQLDTFDRIVLCCNPELFDIALPEGIASRLEKGQIDAAAACGLFHLADGDHRRREGGRDFKNLTNNILKSVF